MESNIPISLGHPYEMTLMLINLTQDLVDYLLVIRQITKDMMKW